MAERPVTWPARNCVSSALRSFQRRLGQIPAVEMEKVEGVEDQLVAGAFRQRILQQRETADALVVEHDDFAVDDGIAARQAANAAGRSP